MTAPSPPLAALEAALRQAGIRVLTGEPLSHLTTFRIGGRADLTALPLGLSQLRTVLELSRREDLRCPLLVLGRGSNVLADDAGFRGLVVLTGGANRTVFSEDPAGDGRTLVTADCGVSLTGLSHLCVSDGRALDGLAFAYGIPGSVGGAAVMNAGAFGGDMAGVTVGCECLDLDSGAVLRLDREALRFGYRRSVFTDRPAWIVLRVFLSLPGGDADDIRARMARFAGERRRRQPLDLPSAGSVFLRSPSGDSMGRLIEACGLKGLTIGGARISEKHAGFIVNAGRAKAADVRALIERASRAVEERYGFRPKPEIRLPGDGSGGRG